MKFPKTFRPGKNLENNIDKMLKEEKHDESRVKLLMDDYKKFLEQRMGLSLIQTYHIAENFAKKLDYNKHDLMFLSPSLDHEYGGFYLSALVNNIITDADTIVFKINLELEGLGRSLEKGTVIIEGNPGDSLADFMQGGQLIIKGDVKGYIGYKMKGGIIKVCGNIDMRVPFSTSCKGKIYHNDDLIYPKKVRV